MDITGNIVEIFETQQITDSFKKREFVVEYLENPSYPEFIKFEIIQDRCALLDDYKSGDRVSVSFNLKGRKWTDPQGQTKYFNSLQAWRLEEVSSGTEAPPPPMESNEPSAEPEWLKSNSTKKDGGPIEEDDLPF